MKRQPLDLLKQGLKRCYSPRHSVGVTSVSLHQRSAYSGWPADVQAERLALDSYIPKHSER